MSLYKHLQLKLSEIQSLNKKCLSLITENSYDEAKTLCHTILSECSSVESEIESLPNGSFKQTLELIVRELKSSNKERLGAIDIIHFSVLYVYDALRGGADKLLYIFLTNKAFLEKNKDSIKNIKEQLLKRCLYDFLEHKSPYSIFLITNNFDFIPDANIGFDCYNLCKTIDFLRLCSEKWHMSEGIDSHYILAEEAILFYYLGGTALSFKLFDEVLDTDYHELSAKELFYYSLVSYLTDIDFLSISSFAVNCISPEEDESLYYKGHIHLLRGEIKEAISCFQSSSSLVYAKWMTAYLIDKKEIIQSPKVRSINPESDSYNVFTPYYHYHECLIAIKGYNISPTIANYFRGEKEPLIENIRVHKAEELSKVLYLDLNNRLVELAEDEYKKRITILNELLGERDPKVRRAFFETMKGIELNLDPEIQLALTIQEFECENADFYAVLIYNYFFRKLINIEQVIYLSFYVVYIAKKKIRKETFDALFNAGMSFISAVKVLSPYGCIAQFKKLCLSPSLHIAIDLSKERKNIKLGETTEYVAFKKRLKLTLLNIKENIGEKEFNSSYRFVSIIDKIQQFDQYIKELTSGTIKTDSTTSYT